MKISLNWLKDYLDLPYPPERVGEMLTSLGLEVEGQEEWVSVPGELEGVVVGEILTCTKHPNADKLSLTTVDIGAGEPIQVVCGAPNVAPGQFVLVATVGTTLHPTTGDPLLIKKGKIRGEVSMGMICAEDELGIGESHDGILVLKPPHPPGTPASNIITVSKDVVFEIGLTPNRSDATSHRGVAADLRAYLVVHDNYTDFLRSSRDPLPTIDIPRSTSPVQLPVVVQSPLGARRYAGVVLDNISVGPSPEWRKHRLEAIGVRSINNVVDATNYILHDLGQPLHAFDLDKLTAQGIWVGTLPQNTPFQTLDEVERKLDEKDLMICDAAQNPLCLAGVFGGKGSGVTASTKRIFLESACFDATMIRRTATRHKLHTDAARSFEKGVDPAFTARALHAAVRLLYEVAGAHVASEYVDIQAAPIVPAQVVLKLDQVRARTGVDASLQQVQTILQALDFSIVDSDERAQKLVVDVPTARADVWREADVIEEFLRVYGYDNVPLPKQIKLTPAVSSYPSAHQLRRRAAEYLLGQGLHEAMGLSLVPTKVYEALAPELVGQLVQIHNTSTVELDAMRVDLVPTGLQAIAHNQNRQQLDLACFEFGKGYRRGQDQQPIEYEQLAVWTTGARHREHWSAGEASTSYSHVRGLAQGVLTSVGVSSDGESEGDSEGSFAYAQNLLVDGQVAATVGRIAPAFTQYFDTKSEEIYLALIHWPVVVQVAKSQVKTVEEISRFPQVRRDLAVVVDKSVTFGQIVDLTREPAGSLVKSIELFDVYEDEARLGAGKRSYAIRFVFERLDRTLKDKEVDKAMQAVTQVLDAQPSMEVRR